VSDRTVIDNIKEDLRSRVTERRQKYSRYPDEFDEALREMLEEWKDDLPPPEEDADGSG